MQAKRLIRPPAPASRAGALALALALALGPVRASAQGAAAVSGDRAPGTGAAAAEGEQATSAVPLSNDPALEYKLGTQAYALGNYEQAVAHFERSFALSNHPYLLYNLGMAYSQWYGLSADLGHLRKAQRLFHNYIKALAEDPQMDQEQRDDAEAQIARLDQQIADHEAKARAAEGPKEPVVVTQPPPVIDAPPPAKVPVYRRGWFWGVVAVGALAVAGGVTAGVLLGRRDDGGPELGTIGPTLGTAPTGLGFRF